MAKGYTVGIASETKAFKQGIDSGVIKPVEDAEKALNDLGRNKGPEQLERGMKDAQKATERLEDEVKSAADAIDDEFRDAYRKMKQSSDDGLDGAKRGLDDFKSEAGQSGREAAASFSGGFDDVGDFAQETLANGLAGFGPIGAAAGIAAAAGVGVLFTSIQENAEATEERISAMYDDMLESGQRFLSEEYVQQAIGDIGRDAGKFADALKQAEAAGVSVQTMLRALVGDQEAINAVIDATNAKRDEELAKIGANEEGSAAVAAEQDAINLKADETISKLQSINDEQQTAAERAGAVAAAFGTGNAALDESIRKVQDIASTINGIGDKTIRLTADDSDIQRKLGLIQGRTLSINLSGQITRMGNQVW